MAAFTLPPFVENRLEQKFVLGNQEDDEFGVPRRTRRRGNGIDPMDEYYSSHDPNDGKGWTQVENESRREETEDCCFVLMFPFIRSWLPNPSPAMEIASARDGDDN